MQNRYVRVLFTLKLSEQFFNALQYGLYLNISRRALRRAAHRLANAIVDTPHWPPHPHARKRSEAHLSESN